MKNKLKELWANGRPALNGWLSIGNSFTAEIMAAQGYDSLTIDIQHGALDYASALTMFQAMRASGVTPMARTSSSSRSPRQAKKPCRVRSSPSCRLSA